MSGFCKLSLILNMCQFIIGNVNGIPSLCRSSGDIAKLIVGADRIIVSCHKILLSYYSDFFDKALFGSYKELDTCEIRLAEEDPNEINAFVQWIYTGDCPRIAPSENFWRLGDRLGAPEFANLWMYWALCDIEDGDVGLRAEKTEFIYSNTTEHSKLRLITKDRMRNVNLNFHSFSEDFRDSWVAVLEKRGDILKDYLEHDWDKERCPGPRHNWDRYWLDEGNRDPLTWREDESGKKSQIDVAPSEMPVTKRQRQT